MSKLNKLTDDSYFMTEVEAMEWAEWERNSIEEEATNRGFAKGIEQGIEQGIIQTIKKMLDNNIDLNVIANITGKSIDEIKK